MHMCGGQRVIWGNWFSSLWGSLKLTWQQVLLLSDPLHWLLPCIFWGSFSVNLEHGVLTILADQQISRIHLFWHPHHWVTDVCHCTQLFMFVQDFHTQISILVWQALYLLSHPHSPRVVHSLLQPGMFMLFFMLSSAKFTLENQVAKLRTHTHMHNLTLF